MHSGAAAKSRERTDLCTIGLGMCYVGDLGLWWGCACSVAFRFLLDAASQGYGNASAVGDNEKRSA